MKIKGKAKMYPYTKREEEAEASSNRKKTLIKGIPVIFLIGMFPKHEEKKQGRMVAGNMLFDKPYDTEQLLLAINKALSERIDIR